MTKISLKYPEIPCTALKLLENAISAIQMFLKYPKFEARCSYTKRSVYSIVELSNWQDVSETIS